MIGQLTGQLVEKTPPSLLINVNGVGYEVSAPMSTFYQLPELNDTLTLVIHSVIREDQHSLYGFINKPERELFRGLIKVNGVGPKLALAILSGIEAEHFVLSVQNSDINRLVKIPGVGKKTAERLLIEMQGKFSAWDTASISHQAHKQQPLEDAISALTTLGYKNTEANKAVKAIHHNDHSSEELIRLALRHMAKG